MLNIKKSLASMVFVYPTLLPLNSIATVNNFGDITNSTSATGIYSTLVINSFVFDDADTFNFSLNAADKSDISISVNHLFGINTFDSYFSLKQGAVEIGQILLYSLYPFKPETFTFYKLANGNYSLTLIPSTIFALNLGGTVTISANSVTIVPEPETNALMFLGLGIIGMIARRKFA